MPKRASKKRKAKRVGTGPFRFFQELRDDLREDVRREVSGLLMLFSVSLMIYSLFAPNAGRVGRMAGAALRQALGDAAFLLPLTLGFWGLGLVLGWKRVAAPSFKAGVALVLGAFPALLGGSGPKGGGAFGHYLNTILQQGFGTGGRLLILSAALVIGTVLLTSQRPGALVGSAAGYLIEKARAVRSGRGTMQPQASADQAGEEGGGIGLGAEAAEELETGGAGFGVHLTPPESVASPPPAKNVSGFQDAAPPAGMSTEEGPPGDEFEAPHLAETAGLETEHGTLSGPSSSPVGEDNARQEGARGGYEQLSLPEKGVYQLPPLSLLKASQAHSRWTKTQREVSYRKKLLEDTLRSFGVEVRVLEVEQGPAVTRFEVQPAPGVKVARIASLADDIALSMAAPGVRIVAPIPGKAAMGIEVPNPEVSTVYLREVLESREFQQSSARLPVALGLDVSGTPVVSSLERMVHLLVAGATGSGKSVCINSILCSLLFRATPAQLRLLLIDPKVVELSGYNGIPHLLTPVVTDIKKAAGCLRWVVKEMERRYTSFAETGVRDISRYNQLMLMRGEQELPYIVVVVDELADLMMVAPVEVEDSVQRLAQMARAAGIHLILATQRPSVDVITGVIKANIPSRIAFAVSSQVDSRTILDASGAEKLLGRGDMLFHPIGASKPVRVQGAFIPESDLEHVLNFIKKQGVPECRPEVLAQEQEETKAEEENRDELFPEAVRVVLETGQASVSILQRRLRIGYTRAGRLIDLMEERGIVGPHQGPKPREILITAADYRRLFGGHSAGDHSEGVTAAGK